MAQLVKNPPAMHETCSIPGLRRSPGEGRSYPFQYSDLENAMDCTVHGVAKSQTRLSIFHFIVFQNQLGSIPGLEDPLEKGKATHCSILGLP